MQCGFGMLEAGTVQMKNTRNILLKNMMDACIGALVWYSIGHGVAYDGNNAFIGSTEGSNGPSFFAHGYHAAESDSGADFAGWWFQYVFAAAASTIVSGAMAERTALSAYFVCMLASLKLWPCITAESLRLFWHSLLMDDAQAKCESLTL